MNEEQNKSGTQNTGSQSNNPQTPPEYENFKSEQKDARSFDVDEASGDRFEGTDRTGTEEKPHGDINLEKGLEAQVAGGEG